ncbi:uncharacterized protein LOC132109892 [Carassius carassius]|uniref:uncharacterized protein LOC132109892 n=1 Tax=Carassius carassius TaxID=217509 RepID=UPI0028685EA6|nr:uncharacterized protein LOC132109892 [Carassius carassius]
MADKLKVEEARNGEENTAPVDEAHLLTNGEEHTTQGQLVTPSGVQSSYAPDKTAAPDNFITEASVSLSASNSRSEPSDQGLAETQSPNVCKASTLRCGEKRPRESEDPSDVPVKRRVRASEDSRKESVPNYDARCAELWIDGETAACEAYESSKSAQRQRAVRQHANGSDFLRLIQTKLAACFLPIAKMLRLSMEQSRADFAGVISTINAMQRDTRQLTNEVRNMRVEGRQILDTISLMNERMSVIQRLALDLQEVLTTRR